MDFSLIETLRHEPDTGFIRLRLHLARLTRSARRLGFAGAEKAEERLREAVAEIRSEASPFSPTGSRDFRVRLTLDPAGRIDITTAAFMPLAAGTVWTVAIANTRLASSDPLLRYKTTRRALYEAARAEYTPQQADEVILLNEKGEVCEGTITSVFLDDGSGQLRTPPIACGLLAGVLRTELICRRRARVGRITSADLERGTLYVGNSLRGLIPARLVHPATDQG